MNRFLDREPAVARALAGSLVGWLLSFLVLHGVVTNTQASTVDQAVVPIVAALLIALVGFLIRRVVTPATRWITDHASVELQAVENMLTPKDLATIGKLLEDKLGTTAVGLLDRIDEKLAAAQASLATTTVRQVPAPAKNVPRKPAAAKKVTTPASTSRK